MRKLLIVFICFGAWHFAISQTIEIRTNGYISKFNKIDTLFYSEYPLSSATYINAKKDDFNSVSLKHAFGIITKTRPDNQNIAPSFITSYYAYQDGTLQAPTRQLFFKTSDISAFKKAYGDMGYIEEHSVFKGFYYLYVNTSNYTTGESIFELCKLLFNEKIVSFIEPVFIRHVKSENPLRPFEWNIRNSGIVPGGIVAADMKVENAWCYSTGTNIKVAVIDDGVDLTQPDLQANLLPGYDATGNNSGGAPTNNNGHGTNCAGIIASVDNTIGTIGVAFNSRIIPLRLGIADIFGYNTNDTWIANCFNEAVNRGADVISNSWGGGSVSVQINLAIQNAVSQGRNGLGCVVLFSDGNNNANVSYPAYLPEVIAVGASTPCDTRKRSSNNPALVNPGVSTDPEGTSCDGEFWWGSNFGTNLDVVAPGVWITTTDNVGTHGIVNGDYNDRFNGTSAACPNAAAVVALILGANPNLTGLQARNTLESSCFKIPQYQFSGNVAGQPNGTWNNQVGYGRIDADRAVRATLGIPQMSVNGADAICLPLTSSAYTTVNLPTCGTNTINWTRNISQVTISPLTGPSTTLSTNGYAGPVTLTAIIVNSNGTTTILPKTIYAGTSPTCSTRTGYWYVNGNQTLLGKCNILNEVRCTNAPSGPNNPSLCEYFANAWVEDPTATSVVWSYVSSSGYTSWTANGNQVEVTINTNSPNGWIRLKCTTSNPCGSYNWDFWFTHQGSTAKCPVYFDPDCLQIERPVKSVSYMHNNIVLSPNPSTGKFMVTLKSQDKNAGIREVVIINKMGMTVYRKKFSGFQLNETISISGLPTDIYTVRIFDGNDWLSEKLSLRQ